MMMQYDDTANNDIIMMMAFSAWCDDYIILGIIRVLWEMKKSHAK